MAISVIGPIPSREMYESINEKMFGSKTPQPVDGLIVHTAGDGPEGFCVVDVWESREAFDEFINNQVMPAMEEMGIPMEGGTPPTIVDVAYVVVNEEVASRH